MNGAPIYEDALARQVEADARRYRKFGGGRLPPVFAERLRQRALDKLIAVELLYQAGRGTEIPDLDQRIDARLRDFERRHDASALAGTDAERRAWIERDVRVRAYIERLGLADPEVPEADVRRYYDEHGKTAFSREESIHARHILVRVAAHADREAKAAACRKVEQARKEILAGKDFAVVAKEYSEDNLADSGGDLSYIRRGYMPPEFDQVAFSLKANTLSDVVETTHGCHLIEVLDRKPAGLVPYEEIRGFITKHLKNRVSREKREAVVAGLRAAAAIEIVNR